MLRRHENGASTFAGKDLFGRVDLRVDRGKLGNDMKIRDALRADNPVRLFARVTDDTEVVPLNSENGTTVGESPVKQKRVLRRHKKAPFENEVLKKSTQSGGRSERSDMTGRVANRTTVGESPRKQKRVLCRHKKAPFENEV